MLTRIQVRNFKRFDDAEIDLSGDLGAPVVLIGPNNSGKTTVLQALSLWHLGVRTWLEKRGAASKAEKRPGIAINRRDLTQAPVPQSDLLWKGTSTHRSVRIGDKTSSRPVRIEIEVEGLERGTTKWSCGMEFDYGNEETFNCRPLRMPGFDDAKVEDCQFSRVPEEAGRVEIAFLPPMSGLASEEPRVDRGRIDVLLGQGQSAQVIRNLCAQVADGPEAAWEDLYDRIKMAFGVELMKPEYLGTRGEYRMTYRDLRESCVLDLSASGRGLQQTLLLLSYLHAKPRSILLLDEPDAHLEILRQRQVFNTVTELAERQGSQVIAASHSEVVLDEAADRGIVVAFVGKPHRLNGQPQQLRKALVSIGYDAYYEAELRGWILYAEGPTDLRILQEFAVLLKHADAIAALESPFVHYLGTNRPQEARDHFYGLLEAKPDLVGIAVFDRIDAPLQRTNLVEVSWTRREIENYLTSRELLMRVARGVPNEDLFSELEMRSREGAMDASISEIEAAAESLNKPPIWSPEAKASDEVLEPIFRAYARRLGVPLEYRKRDFYELVRVMKPTEVDQEVVSKLDDIASICRRRMPRL